MSNFLTLTLTLLYYPNVLKEYITGQLKESVNSLKPERVFWKMAVTAWYSASSRISMRSTQMTLANNSPTLSRAVSRSN